MASDPPPDAIAAQPHGPAHVLIASRDQAYAHVLARTLLAQGMEALVWSRPWNELPVRDRLGWIDVLLVETEGLTDAEWDLLEAMREESPVTEVIAISSEPLLEDAVQALRAGAFSVLEYPVSSGQLVNEISKACARKRHGEQRLRQLGAEHLRGGGEARHDTAESPASLSPAGIDDDCERRKP